MEAYQMKQQKIVRIPDEYTVVINVGADDKMSQRG